MEWSAVTWSVERGGLATTAYELNLPGVARATVFRQPPVPNPEEVFWRFTIGDMVGDPNLTFPNEQAAMRACERMLTDILQASLIVLAKRAE